MYFLHPYLTLMNVIAVGFIYYAVSTDAEEAKRLAI